MFKTYFKKLKSILFYIADRKILLISLTYILSQASFVAFSWNGFLMFFLFSIFLIFKLKKLFFIVILTVLFCFARNYIDYYVENQTKDSGDNYLNQSVEFEGYVVKEPVYKHEYATVVFKVKDEKNFLIQTNTPRFPRLKVGQVCNISGKLEEPRSSEEFDYKQYLANKRIYYVMRYPVLDCVEKREGFFLKNALMDLKGSIRRVVERRLSEPQASLFLGILFGDKRVFEEEFKEALRIASITHIIVASGYHASIIFLGINKLLFFIPKRPRILVVVVFIWIYCLLVGLSPSIVRASIMLTFTLLAVYYGVVSNINIIFFTTIFCFILLDPRIIKDMGFLLSISATGSLIYITPILDVYIQKVLDVAIPFQGLRDSLYSFLKNYFVPSFACTIGTIPIIAYSFQKVTIIGVISNMLILPVLEYTLTFGFITLFLNVIFSSISEILFLTIWAQLKYFELVVNYLGNLQNVSFDTNITVPIVLLVYLLIALFILLLSPKDAKNYYLSIQEDF